MVIILLNVISLILTVPIVVRFLIWVQYIQKNNTSDKLNNTVEWSKITIRILTIGENEDVVNRTISSVSSTDAEIQVISEKDIETENGKVYVVEDIETKATYKGKALEWARRELDCREYILYLDEDSILETTDQIPDGDMVQLRQIPQNNGSIFSWYAELHRIGVAREIESFDPQDPKYVWGGGLLIKSEIEDEITWDRNSITEDGEFIRKALSKGYKYYITNNPKIINYSPPDLLNIIEQRRRWNSGNGTLKERIKKVLSSWGKMCWISNSLLFIYIILYGLTQSYIILLSVLIIYTISFIWIYSGLKYYNTRRIHYIITFLTVPVITFYNGIGNLYAIIKPTSEFNSTSK